MDRLGRAATLASKGVSSEDAGASGQVTKTVLLVEDEQGTRDLLTIVLDQAGYTCVPAASPAEALQRGTAAGLVDVVVTDVMLDGDDLGGLRLMTELRAAGVYAPVIVITAYADFAKVKTALNQGAAYLLEKPFRGGDLLDVIERLDSGSEIRRVIERAFFRARLTEKERTVARRLLEGLSSSEIAEIEKNSPKTIRQHVSQIYAKCGVASRSEFFRRVYGG